MSAAWIAVVIGASIAAVLCWIGTWKAHQDDTWPWEQ